VVAVTCARALSATNIQVYIRRIPLSELERPQEPDEDVGRYNNLITAIASGHGSLYGDWAVGLSKGEGSPGAHLEPSGTYVGSYAPASALIIFGQPCTHLRVPGKQACVNGEGLAEQVQRGARYARGSVGRYAEDP
jgi:hypothetical protein